ncbi:hypothetical protein MCEMSEM23_02518 [Rhabdaerophilaceae bacterium]
MEAEWGIALEWIEVGDKWSDDVRDGVAQSGMLAPVKTRRALHVEQKAGENLRSIVTPHEFLRKLEKENLPAPATPAQPK